jgi:ATP-dependent RNA helicase DHX29
MAKKKKSSLAPVNRGFATTSQAKKPVPIVEEPVEPEPVAEELKTTSSEGAKGDGVKKDGPKGNGQDDWEDEIGLEEGIYQGYVERLQEKGEKEINRIIKVSMI